MASANVDLVRSIYAAWERGDFSSAGVGALRDRVRGRPRTEPGSWTGLAGMAAAGHERLSPWDNLRAEVDEYRELNDRERAFADLGLGREADHPRS